VRLGRTKLVSGYNLNVTLRGEYFWLTYFAFGANGVVYADDVPGGVGFEAHQQLVSVSHAHVSLLWEEENVAPK
jgi:hypothetical protein